MSGDELRQIIKDLGYELKSVATLMNITPQHLNSLLKSKDMKLSTIKTIAESINKSVYEVIEGEMLLSAVKKTNNKPDDDTSWKEKHHKLSMELNECRKVIDKLRIENHRLKEDLMDLRYKYEGNEGSDTKASATKKDVKSA